MSGAVTTPTRRVARRGATAKTGPIGRLGRLVWRFATRVWLLVLLIAGWELVTRGGTEGYFPAPSLIMSTLRDMWFTGPAHRLFLNDKAVDDFTYSLTHLFGGWLLASIVGIVIGVALGRSRTATEYLDPLLQLGRAMPPITLIPVFIILFKVGETMQVATIVFGVVWPVLLNTIDGARTVDSLQIDTARVFGITGVQRLRQLILPAAAPKIFAGLRVSLSLALILMVISELIGATAGIGDQLLLAQRSFELPKMWAGIVLLGILGYLFNAVFMLVEHRLLAWHTGARRLAE
jgi:ABC-type nitrate/sulfonate/bicarbonate transport system permease component